MAGWIGGWGCDHSFGMLLEVRLDEPLMSEATVKNKMSH